ncbi:MAG: CopM family metallochaperone [Rickettsiales bacterium]
MFLRSLISPAALAVAVISLSTTTAHAAESTGVKTHHHNAQKAQPKATQAASTKAYERAMRTMHKSMDTPRSGNPDIDFVRQMIPHHQGAIEMAKIQLKYGHDARLKKLTEWITTAQGQEIATMRGWQSRYDHGEVSPNARDYYGTAMKKMHHAMMIDYTGDADLDFVRGMIAHHQGAIDMASIWMHEGSNPDLKEFVTGIVTAQSQEIAWMQRWLAQHESN